MFKNIPVILLVIFSSTSCSRKSNDNYKKIYIVSKDSWEKENRVDSVNFRIIKDEKEFVYEYKDIINDSFHKNWIRKKINNAKFLTILDEECILVDTVSFVFNNKKRKVYKYLYDVKESIDEETDYYFNEDYGIIYARDDSWGIDFLYNPKELKPLHDSILKNVDKFKSSFKLKTETKN